MAWEKRPSGKFYYRGERRGGRVVKRYFGRGKVAEMVAEVDARARQDRDTEGDDLRRLRAFLEPADAAMEALDDVCRLALESVLTCEGFHLHNYSWRKRRGWGRAG
jgi:hypothetical protein